MLCINSIKVDYKEFHGKYTPLGKWVSRKQYHKGDAIVVQALQKDFEKYWVNESADEAKFFE